MLEAANGRALLFDEISELSIEQQAKLPHVLQEKMLIRVGETKAIDLHIRVSAATNKSLEELPELFLKNHETTVKAAEALGDNRSTVSRKIAQYNLKEIM